MTLDINTAVLLIIALINILNTLLGLRTHAAVQGVQIDVHTIEVATNSMKDELVKATGKASFAAGQAAEKAGVRDRKLDELIADKNGEPH